MIRKGIAILAIGLAFAVSVFDNLYKLRELEWVPDILTPILIVTSLYIWNPEWLNRRKAGEPQSPAKDPPNEPSS